MSELCPMCSDPCKEIEKLTSAVPVKFIECPKWSKLLMFAQLPDGFKKASKYDLMINDELKVGTMVIIQSFHSKVYQSYKITSSTDIAWLMEYVKEGKCFAR